MLVDWLLRHGVDLGHVDDDAELPIALVMVIDANDGELNRLFGFIPN